MKKISVTPEELQDIVAKAVAAALGNQPKAAAKEDRFAKVKAGWERKKAFNEECIGNAKVDKALLKAVAGEPTLLKVGQSVSFDRAKYTANKFTIRKTLRSMGLDIRWNKKDENFTVVAHA